MTGPRSTAFSVLAGMTLALLVWCPGAAAGTGPGEAEAPERVITFGGSRNYPPFEWLGEEGPRGFNIDLEDAIAEQAGVTIEHRLSSWDEALQALDDGEVDVVPMFVSEERTRRFLFSDPFYYLTHGIFSRHGGEVASEAADLDGRRVAVVDGGYAWERLEPFGAERVPVRDIGAALEALTAGQVEFAVLARHTARRLISDGDLAVDQVSPPFWPRPYVFGVRGDAPETLAWLQHHLSLVQANGRYYDIYEDWEDELEWSEPDLLDVLRGYAWLFTALLTATLLTGLWSWALRRRVAERTTALRVELERRKAAETEVKYRAFHDMLTGLPNRSQFVKDLDELSARHPEGPLSVAFISLNGIEQLVLTFGYRVGETLVRSFAHRLSEFGFDALSHLGSGLYAVAKAGELSPDTLMQEITDPIQLDDMEIDPGLSIGLTSQRDRPTSPEELLRRARTALSAALANKRPWQEYDPSIEPDRESVILLRDYWRNGTRDFVAHFQPQVDLRDGSVVGAEALARWQHPELGLLMPARFIPFLEDSGLVHRVTMWMVDTAVGFAAQCRRDGRPLPITVNVTASDLLEHDLVTVVRAALGRHGAEATDLRLEMTESGLITEAARVRAILEQLNRMGIWCAIDDFGTGYSSLSYLSEFPVDAIKLDRAFIQSMRQDERHRLIVRSTIELAHGLGLSVIAEGAEDQETADLLADYGCDAAQGYVFAPALPEAEFLGFRDRATRGAR